MADWVQKSDNQILMNRRKILEGNGKIVNYWSDLNGKRDNFCNT